MLISSLEVSLEILKDVHEFCVHNNIKYSLCGGSLIGAIRHDGFIPWDDDVDIVMPRPDYEKFVKCYKSQKGFELFSPELPSSKKVYIRISKVCDMKKTLMLKNLYHWTDTDTGIGIDIIPAEGAPDTEEKAKLHIRSLEKNARALGRYRISKSPWGIILTHGSTVQRIKNIIKKITVGLLEPDSLEKMMRLQRRYDYDKSTYFIAGYIYGLGEWQSKVIFDDIILHKFEDTEFYVTAHYERYLKSLFGNYMELPPEEKRVSHDFFDYYWKD